MFLIENTYENFSFVQELDQMIENVNSFLDDFSQFDVFVAMIITKFFVIFVEFQAFFSSSCEVSKVLIIFVSNVLSIFVSCDKNAENENDEKIISSSQKNSSVELFNRLALIFFIFQQTIEKSSISFIQKSARKTSVIVSKKNKKKSSKYY